MIEFFAQDYFVLFGSFVFCFIWRLVSLFYILLGGLVVGGKESMCYGHNVIKSKLVLEFLLGL